MQDTTANWKAAALTASAGSAGGYSPVWLVELLGVNRYFATRAMPVSSLRLIGDGWEIGSGVLIGEVARAYLLDLAEGGLGEFGIAVEEEGGNVRLSASTVALRNEHDVIAALAVGQIDSTTVRLQLGWDGQGPADALPVWYGVIDRVQVTQDRVTLELIDGTFRKHRNLSVPLGAQYFVGTPAANRNNKIPIILGVHTDVETVQVAGAAVGSSKYALTTGSTALLLVEYGAPFPASGTITIEAETGVTYTARRLVTSPADGKTYLELSGLTRGSPVSHIAGVTVTLTSVVYQYLIGYEVSDLDAVREDGVLLTSGYTQAVVVADRNTSVLNFTTQRGVITVDVNAANISMTNLLTNGGFEAGSLTGWTTGAGATTAVGTSNPTPEEGTYWASLEGDQDAYKDLYQEWSTVPGEDYTVEWSYLDEDSNLLTNGGFENGDLSGWIITTNYIDNALINVVQGTAADGLYSLEITKKPYTGYIWDPILSGLVEAFYSVEIVYDFTVANATTYTWSIQAKTFDLSFGLPFFRHPIVVNGVGIVTAGVASRAFYRLGTPSDPLAYTGTTIAIPVSTIQENGIEHPFLTLVFDRPFGPNGYQTAFKTFTTTGTALRITIIANGTGAGGYPAGPTFFDAMRLQLASEIDTAESAYQLGTPGNTDLYSTSAQGLAYTWFRQRVTFRATDTTARLTLQSRHTLATARKTYFDHVTVLRRFTIHSGSGGENPVEAMLYLIQNFLPQFAVDDAAFATAYSQLLDWRYGLVLTDPGDSKALLQRMATQCQSWVYENAKGQLTIVVRDSTRGLRYGFGATNIVDGSFSALAEPLDAVGTEFYVWFGAKTGGSTSPNDFQGVTYCTPLATTHPKSDLLTGYCAAAFAQYKRTQRQDIFADCIADFYTANLLLERLVLSQTIRADLYTFETWLDAAVLELGDIVIVTDPRQMADLAQPVFAEVIERRAIPQTQTVRITARSLSNAGWSAEWNYDPLILETGGWNNEFNEA